jgi:D-alanyl-D-alanine carboxypeptidase
MTAGYTKFPLTILPFLLLPWLVACVKGPQNLAPENPGSGLLSGAANSEPPGTAGPSGGIGGQDGTLPAPDIPFEDFVARILDAAEIPPDAAGPVLEAARAGPAFLLDLLACLNEEPGLRALVDKNHALPEDHEPEDLVELPGGVYRVNRRGLLLRRAAAEALEEMAAAAGAAGVTLVASSAYRSYRYQAEVYNRVVRELGQEAADRESAPPGRSQHQTGLVVDFGSIDDSFAEDPAGRWMAANAGRFGWSLSFPDGYEAATGYRWESWHYRYLGRELTAFIDTYFGGIQQYGLRFLYEWEHAG